MKPNQYYFKAQIVPPNPLYLLVYPLRPFSILFNLDVQFKSPGPKMISKVMFPTNFLNYLILILSVFIRLKLN